MLLFWQTLKSMFKQKAQLTIFIVLAALLTLLATSSWIVNTRLTNAYSFMGQGTFTYDYLLKFNGKKKTGSNVETITPWFAFSNDYHLITDVNGNKTTLPYVHLGPNGALKALDDKNIDITFTYNATNKVNSIVFKDLDSNAPVFWNNGLYRFNYQSEAFQKSLIGQLYDQNGNLFDHNNLSLIEGFMNNFTRSDISQNTINLVIAYLNQEFADPKSEGDTTLKQAVTAFVNTGIKKWTKDVDLGQGDPAEIPKKENIEQELFTNGLNGDLSFLAKDTSQPLIKINLYYSPSISNNLDVGYNNNIGNAAFSVNDFYNQNNKNSLFKNQPYGPYGFTKSYYALVAKVSNFSYQLREQYEYWDLISNLKYKIINWQPLLEHNQLKIMERYSSFDPTNPTNDVYVVITPQFARSQKLKVGDAIKIGENNNLFVGAIGGDPANIYPTIYDTDIFPNPKTDGIIYVSENVYRGESIIANAEIEENSTLYITHTGNDKSADVATFKNYLATDFRSLNKPDDKNAGLQSRDATKLVYLRYSLLRQTISIYRTITIVLSAVFLIILIFTLVILIKKIINQQKIENGILKANGYSGLTIASSYLAHALVVTGIGVPLGWIIGAVLQFPIMSVFNNYFVIPTNYSFSLIPFAICFGVIGLVSSLSILITAVRQLIISPLDLLNPNKNVKTSKLVNSISNSFSFKKFTTKFRFVMMAVSTKKIGWFFLTFFIASLSLTFATLIPTAISKFSKDYYANLNYNNEYNYTNVVGNIPFSRYQMYDWNGPDYSDSSAYPLEKNSLVSDYLYNGKWLSTTADINANNAHLYAQQLNNMIIFNFMVGKGASLSIGTFYDMYNRYGQNVDIRNQIDTLLCSTMPRAFGKQPVNPTDPNIVDRWTYCAQYATSDIMPGKIRAMWLKNELAKEQFNFTFGTSTYNTRNEDVYTGYTAKILDSSFGLSTYGINANNKTIVFPNQKIKNVLNDSKDLNIKSDTIPMVVNKAAQIRYNLETNKIINTTTNVKQLQYCENGNDCAVPTTTWSYELPSGFVDDNINPFTLDLTKLTIGKQNRFGFTGKNGTVQDYYNIKNFVLKLPVNAFKPGEFMNTTTSATTGRTLPGLLDPNPAQKDQQVVKQVGNYYVIHPFDNKFDKEINGIGDLTSGFPTNWYREALRQGLLKIGTTTKNVKYQIIGVQNSYDKPRAYVNQILANKILGFDTNSSQMYDKKDTNPLLWFNGKFSKYPDQVDQTTRFNLSSLDGSYSMIDFMNGQLIGGVGDTDYLIIKAQVIQKLAWISSILSVIFVVITTITAVIIVYIMTESFVNTFLKFIAVMKALGYSNREINSLTLGIFTPFAFLAWILGVAIMWLILWLGVYGFTSIAKVIIPFGFPWLALPITFVLMGAIYLVTYWISTYKINHMSIQEQVNANEV
ncbi:ABC transporter permease [Spiroplasma sp. SV19]|uniref:ABC transporter permease n=1 Tax=Spiroplasma sp. SV19 TaxID=2570468 RepID=UPI0024B69A6A|nr:ABC transporter permease [Spiroplasma sp. SV19]WHQ37204.1 FtsX-like permease family protein [Spiroplasma sp. SV19]